MQHIKIFLEYDGTDYHGWQVQKNTDRTVQEKVEKAVAVVNKSPVRVTGSGRTDAGVHALCQVAGFSWEVDVPLQRIPLALNSNLPPDIICKKAEEVPPDFHARFDVRRKTYRYRIRNSRFPSVFDRRYVYHIYRDLNFAAIKDSAAHFAGTYDFKAFQSRKAINSSTIRTIEEISVQETGDEIKIDVVGNGFLYNMVRIMAGTLIEVGLGKRKIESISRVLTEGEREDAGFTAPAKGLTLMEVEYPEV
ncbi:MAG: tRNA pseudouridine(38-40) synthase TruA [Halanaerobiaceae bacterium]